MTKGKTEQQPTAKQETAATEMDPVVLEKIKELRSRVHEIFGQVVLSLCVTPRYRHLSIGDLSHLVLDPLIRDRIAVAQPANAEGVATGSLAGIAFWANVSEDVDLKIREQIKTGVFPVRLKPEDWTSGKINWLIDVVAPTPKLTASVIANIKQVIKEGELRIHPIVSRLIDADTLRKMGAQPFGNETAPIGQTKGNA